MSSISVSQNTFTIDVNIEELKFEDYHERSIVPYLEAIKDPEKLSDTIKKFKIYKLEDDLDTLVDEQESLDAQIANQRTLYVEKFTAMETAVASFRKTGEFLDNLIASWNSNN